MEESKISISAFSRASIAATDKPLRLTLTPVHDKAGFAIGEPVWLNVDITNTGKEAFSGWYDPSPGQGMSFRVDAGASNKVVLNSFPIRSERYFGPLRLTPGTHITVPVLLNEFLSVLAPGVIQLTCRVDVMDDADKSTPLKGAGSIKFTRWLSDKETELLAKRLDDDLNSESFQSRVKAIQEVQAIQPPVALPLLRRGVTDSNEDVQLVAVRVLAALKDPGAIAVLRLALGSRFETVRGTASYHLQPH